MIPTVYAQATADAPAGIHRFATEDALIARTLGSSLYDSARALLDRLSVDGAFEVGDYEGVQEHLARARTPYPATRGQPSSTSSRSVDSSWSLTRTPRRANGHFS